MTQLPEVFHEGEAVTRKSGEKMLTTRGVRGRMAGPVVEPGFDKRMPVRDGAGAVSEEHTHPATHPVRGKGCPHRRGGLE